MLAACGAPLRPTAPHPAAGAGSVEALAAAIAAAAKRSEGEPDSKVRSELAAQASSDADACMAREPQAAGCLYGRAVALGLEARAHPLRAGELLNTMLACLTTAEAADRDYDQAGPARVRALVLIRAPGWPLGPGDADAGLVAAHRAVALQPQYPPNLLALAEALAKTGDAQGARECYERARAAAQALPATADRDGWLREADEALRRQ
jgi:hypothetical protein